MTFAGPSVLEVPANKEDLFEKAWRSEASSVMIDLEDSLRDSEKEVGRDLVRAQVASHAAGSGKGVAVRVNAVDSPWFADDVEALRGIPVDLVALPMISAVDEIEEAVRVVEKLLGRDGPGLLLVVETPGCVVELRSIVAAARGRVAGLITGGFDFTMAIAPLQLIHRRDDVAPTPGYLDPLILNRLLCLATARAFAIQVFDGLRILDHKDQESIVAASAQARLSGFDGCVAYAPSFIDAINRAFRPVPSDVDWAREIVARMKEAHARGRAASYTSFGTALPHHWEIASRILAEERPA